jgi:DNA-binding CsgD family transcriptional regulator
MATQVRDMTGSEIEMLADVVRDLCRGQTQTDPRPFVADRLLRLLRADTLASYTWDPRKERYEQPVIVNQDLANVARYLDRLQFDDPLTARMRRYEQATIVEAAFPMAELQRTGFYQDFLRPDGMYHGINIYRPMRAGRVIDFRIWRQRNREAFDDRDIALLNTITAFVVEASDTRGAASDQDSLTAREVEIARLVARGCTDRDIARILGISFSTVRTHVNRCFEKLGCANRAELGARFYASLSSQV